MLELSEKDFKAVRIKCFSEELMSTKNRKAQQGNRKSQEINRAYKEKLNGNFWTERYND